ncbi:protein O-glucosyltransferase 2-like isoform X2 [Syngnathoides biaculeatus]|uniref:protein O-glucosyltransferase 2-like isoform X2 n=1 Tax=Syngnathoides biaculeatus TaxID=300417 RepID=UPI002ADD8322|nr:protein O-glucosyltransferase 2-like isoform X2 [Syngnathoides biaculeatus]
MESRHWTNMPLRLYLWSLLGLVLFWTELPLGSRADSTLSPAKTLVWGPGLKANIVLPARFFFIQAVDTSGRNLTSSPGEKTFEVKILSPSEHFIRIWIQVLDRQDGTFLVRYRMYASYMDLHVHVLHMDRHVAKSPYILKGPVYHEGCDCPQPDGAVWQSHMRCPHSFPQIEHDLSHFANVDPDRNAREIPQRFGQRQSLCHYTIKENKVYVQTLGEHVGFRIFMDAILLSLSRKVKLPDMEFFVNLGDWPLEKRKPPQNIHPIFSWCGSNNTRDIVMPTYDLTESVLETMGRVSLDMMSVQANTGPPWAKKNATAFWRGRDSRQERLELVKLSRAHPHTIDAAFTNFFFFKHDESLYGPLVKHVSFFDFFKYKYQINIDGTVAAYRLPYLLAGDSVVLKQDSGYYEHFYNELIPWEHYIPVRADLQDLLEKIQWAKDHDEEEYAKLQVTEPKIREGMELVEHPSDDLFPCSCLRKQETVKVPFGTKCLVAVLCVPTSSEHPVSTAVTLTHGAGGDMNFKHLVSLAHCLASRGFLCLRFTCKGLNLAYRVKAYRAVWHYLKSLPNFTIKHTFFGGRSMGCRAAAALAKQLSDELEGAVQGLVCLSFPLHPPGQTDAHRQRSEDLRGLPESMAVLFVSGTEDNMSFLRKS